MSGVLFFAYKLLSIHTVQDRVPWASLTSTTYAASFSLHVLSPCEGDW